VIGVGSYATVYAGYSPRTNQFFAVKCLEKQNLSAKQLEFQKEEIRLHGLASGHPGVVQLLGVDETSKHVFLVMEFCPGKDLFDLTVERNGFDDITTKNIMNQLLGAVSHCHSKGIAHRDIKPENCVFSNKMNVKLIDFGLATNEAHSTERGVGSMPYMAPELFQECNPTNSRRLRYDTKAVDVWSLGVVTFSVRFAKTIWNKPSVEDPAFAQFLEDPTSLKRAFRLSEPAYQLAQRVFQLDPKKRCSLDEFRILLSRISEFQEPISQPKIISRGRYSISGRSVVSSAESTWDDDMDLNQPILFENPRGKRCQPIYSQGQFCIPVESLINPSFESGMDVI
ncbi:kinase-like protein, partial [Rozella allomycis CSF55]